LAANTAQRLGTLLTALILRDLDEAPTETGEPRTKRVVRVDEEGQGPPPAEWQREALALGRYQRGVGGGDRGPGDEARTGESILPCHTQQASLGSHAGTGCTQQASLGSHAGTGCTPARK
jgi:hypothetical protein